MSSKSTISHNMTPTDKVTDFSVGFRNVKEAAEKAIYNFEDEGTGVITRNALCLDIVPRYVYNPDGFSPCVNPATSLGDVMASLVYLSSRIDSLEHEIGVLKKKQDVSDIKSRSDQEEVGHMGQHVAALENNLRCLRQTLTYGDLEEDDLPELEGCSFAGGIVKQKVQAIEALDHAK